MMLYLSSFVLFYAMPYVITEQAFYKAAVVELASNVSNVEERFFHGSREYFAFMEQAGRENVDIIVFPEYGLTGSQLTNEDLQKFGIELPNPSNNVLPCIVQNSYNQLLTNLSCAAKRNKIYVVANVIEKINEDENVEYHNTNIVLDRYGILIARYRKINLSPHEDIFVPGNKIDTFKTDFNVNFGMFISSDISFKRPSLDVLKDHQVTDIIYSNHQSDFQTSSLMQHGYVKSNGVNLLTATLKNLNEDNEMGQIYVYNGTIIRNNIHFINSSKMITAELPVFKLRPDIFRKCQNGHRLKSASKTNNFFSSAFENSLNYVTLPLNLSENYAKKILCSKGEDFCCTFEIQFEVTTNSSYLYKLMVVEDPLKFCAIAACINENITSCGGINEQQSTGISFKNISVTTITLQDNADRPFMLLPNLTISNNYNYCKHRIENIVEITVSITNKEDSLTAIGIFILDYNSVNNLNNIILNWFLFVTCTVTVLTIIYKRGNFKIVH
ncbi:hypothetical protein FQA39_LY04680 [Lamprigera yunnana]|nr:hypothetical protein FQA39_LY04680 [Lamprigera yunnana]